MLDDDCNGIIDDNVGMMQWRDLDADGYGDPATLRLGCTMLTGYDYNDDDCNDTTASIHPGAAEPCDNTDHDCDGMNDASDPQAEMWCTTRPHAPPAFGGTDQCRFRMPAGRNACQLACDTDYLDCDNPVMDAYSTGSDANGCETSDGAANCGRCGYSCPSGMTCRFVSELDDTLCACNAPCGSCFMCGAGSCCYQPGPGAPLHECLVGSSC
jgi:hypothetical protein